MCVIVYKVATNLFCLIVVTDFCCALMEWWYGGTRMAEIIALTGYQHPCNNLLSIGTVETTTHIYQCMETVQALLYWSKL